MRIALMKLLVNSVGKLSDGISLSKKYGFTSGKMLDYIYQNKPSGRYVIGKLIDNIYLSHIGWEAIRIRKKHLEEHLETAIINCLSNQKKAIILDVAAGPARYILNTLNKFNDENIYAICRDIDERWLLEGKINANQLGLDNIRFEKGDAFNPESFKSLSVKPNIIVSSGFYDWITNDELVKRSIKIIYDNLHSGGYFVFTNQSGHVDLKLVSEVFEDFNHQPLRMTTRKAELIKGWVKDCGFNVLETKQDKNKYYSVTIAQKL